MPGSAPCSARWRRSAVLALALGVGLAATAATAQTRIATTSLPCAALRALVERSGAVVLGTGGHTYERFVSDHRFCTRSETTAPAYAAAADTPECFVAYRCKDRSRDPIGSVD